MSRSEAMPGDDVRDVAPDESGLTVAVTGAGGLMGQRFVRRLLDNEAVGRVVGIDIADPGDLPMDPRLDLRTVDIRDARLWEQFEGCDAVVHLAFWFNPTRDEVAMRSVNVDGTRNVFQAAVKAGVGKVVYTSSYVVYGGHPDNDFPLTEASALRTNPDFNYAEHKYEVERWLWSWLEDHPDLTVTVFRPAIVVGAGVDNFLSRQAELPRFITVKGYHPPWQCVHVDDVVRALELAIDEDLDGAFNVAAEGWLSHDETMRIVGRKTLELPEALAFEVVTRLWSLGLYEAPPGEIHYIMHPNVVSVDKLVSAGWEPVHSNRDALAEFVAEHEDYVNLLVLRTTKRKALAAVGGAITVLLALVLRWALRRRGDEA